MARAAGKRGGKPKATTAPVTQPQTQSTAGPPTPFEYAPASLQPFLSTLPTDHIYLVHLDVTPTSLKKRVFLVPLLLNLLITIGLCIRAYYAAPVYLQQIITIFGYDTDYKVDAKKASAGELVSTIASRTALLMVDYTIFALIGSWPKQFMFGSRWSRYTGPWTWRRTIGFQDTEIIVRCGRMWDTPLLTSEVPEQTKTWVVDEELTIKVKVEPAMRPSYLAKTGSLLLDKDWDLDYKAMVDAHRLDQDGTIQMRDMSNLTMVYYQKRWLIWRVYDQRDITPEEAEQDSVVEKFRRKLAECGAESVFFRWIEIVQFETSQPGGFTPGRQADALRELKRLLAKRGVDYGQFWDDIGGQAGVPGFAQT
ncbi:hypothetical protein PV08_09788 [Exophiala spinifera]|uniref:Uncharacterized protein n=1 Tax=Exophiala spinifera TaxID=91928 RepID=A0A0D1YCA7_9EURO|nr:uncharacterized protein PV08_09788 [Exophiala spinifera]KIW12511.1 hypothetical protein PV08_09788 [Exophiala spinifera]